MPCDYSQYPANWLTEIRPTILDRAGHKCEFCGIANYQPLPVTDQVCNDAWLPFPKSNWPIAFNAAPLSPPPWAGRVVLTIAHLDHDINHNDPENLRALCQKCHNTHDGPKRARNRARNRQRDFKAQKVFCFD